MDYIIKYKLDTLFYLNDKYTQKQILEVLSREPSETDSIGFVYGFNKNDHLSKSNYDFYIKLGRTIRDPHTRISEWNGDQIFCKKSIYNKKFERLVHLFFNFAHEIIINKSKRELEWFHFTDKFRITENKIVRYVTYIDDIINELYSSKSKSIIDSSKSKSIIDLSLDKPTKDKLIIDLTKPDLIDIDKKSSVSKVILKECIDKKCDIKIDSDIIIIKKIISTYNNSQYLPVEYKNLIIKKINLCFDNDKKYIKTSLKTQKEIIELMNNIIKVKYIKIDDRLKLFNILKLYYNI
jgi:hypothetical protein